MVPRVCGAARIQRGALGCSELIGEYNWKLLHLEFPDLQVFWTLFILQKSDSPTDWHCGLGGIVGSGAHYLQNYIHAP